MIQIKAAFHDLRFKFDILKINYRHHRYTSNNNPKVIQDPTKRPRFTLRADLVSDKAEAESNDGEFLGFSGEYAEENEVEQDAIEEPELLLLDDSNEKGLQKTLSSSTKTFCLHPSHSKGEPTNDNQILTNRVGCLGTVSLEDTPIVIKQVQRVVPPRSNGQEFTCTCHQYQQNLEEEYISKPNEESQGYFNFGSEFQYPYSASLDPYPDEIPESKKLRRFFSFSKNKGKRRRKNKKLANIPSPIIELNTGSPGIELALNISVNQKEKTDNLELSSKPRLELMSQLIQENDFEKENNLQNESSSSSSSAACSHVQNGISGSTKSAIHNQPPLSFQGKINHFTRNFSLSSDGVRDIKTSTSSFSARSDRSEVTAIQSYKSFKLDKRRDEGAMKPVAWKTVYNPVSMNAARISTGAPLRPISYRNLSSDFTSVRYSEFELSQDGVDNKNINKNTNNNHSKQNKHTKEGDVIDVENKDSEKNRSETAADQSNTPEEENYGEDCNKEKHASTSDANITELDHENTLLTSENGFPLVDVTDNVSSTHQKQRLISIGSTLSRPKTGNSDQNNSLALRKSTLNKILNVSNTESQSVTKDTYPIKASNEITDASRPNTSHSSILQPSDPNYQLVSPAYSALFSNYLSSDGDADTYANGRSTKRLAVPMIDVSELSNNEWADQERDKEREPSIRDSIRDSLRREIVFLDQKENLVTDVGN